MNMHIHINIYTYIKTYIHIHTYIYIYAYTHIQSQWAKSEDMTSLAFSPTDIQKGPNAMGKETY